MNKEFTTYEQALVLKDLDFDEPCFAWYVSKEYGLEIGKVIQTDLIKDAVVAPTFHQAFRFFREKHNLYSEINLDSYKEPYSLKVTIKHLDDTNTFVDKEYYPYSNGIGDIDNKKYEEAEQACLDKLIEIVKSK
jgi:hypothetical protein